MKIPSLRELERRLKDEKTTVEERKTLAADILQANPQFYVLLVILKHAPVQDLRDAAALQIMNLRVDKQTRKKLEANVSPDTWESIKTQLAEQDALAEKRLCEEKALFALHVIMRRKQQLPPHFQSVFEQLILDSPWATAIQILVVLRKTTDANQRERAAMRWAERTLYFDDKDTQNFIKKNCSKSVWERVSKILAEGKKKLEAK